MQAAAKVLRRGEHPRFAINAACTELIGTLSDAAAL